jgi:NADPH2:quinone reductase
VKVVQMRRFGGPEVLEVVEKPTPIPGPGEVRVEIAASGINFAETLIRQNRYAVTPELPHVPGVEAAGVIAATGPGVSGVRIGDRVAVPLFEAFGFSGGYADHVLAKPEDLVPIPRDLPFEHATALMIQGLTALQLIKEAPPRGKRVLVNAAAGGVGSLLVQLAKRAGASSVVAAASSRSKLDFARSLGADAVVDYTQPRWPSVAQELTGGAGPDIIYESAGGAVTKGCLEALAPRGQLVIYGALNIQEFHVGVPELIPLIFKNQSIKGFAITPSLAKDAVAAGLAELFALAARGELKVTIGGSYPLEAAAAAHRALEGRSTMGKLVLVPQALR